MLEFHRQIVDAFERLMAGVRRRPSSVSSGFGGERGIDAAAAGLAGSSATWTYLVNDNPFSTLGLSLLASRNVGARWRRGSHGGHLLPVTAIAAASVLIRRWLRKHGRERR